MDFTVELQRIGHSLRKGGPTEIQLERFEEALHDTASGDVLQMKEDFTVVCGASSTGIYWSI